MLPFPLGERIVARLDLKADRGRRVLLVQGAHAEPGVRFASVPASLADELPRMESWLELEEVEVAERGDLVGALRRALA